MLILRSAGVHIIHIVVKCMTNLCLAVKVSFYYCDIVIILLLFYIYYFIVFVFCFYYLVYFELF